MAKQFIHWSEDTFIVIYKGDEDEIVHMGFLYDIVGPVYKSLDSFRQKISRLKRRNPSNYVIVILPSLDSDEMITIGADKK